MTQRNEHNNEVSLILMKITEIIHNQDLMRKSMPVLDLNLLVPNRTHFLSLMIMDLISCIAHYNCEIPRQFSGHALFGHRIKAIRSQIYDEHMSYRLSPDSMKRLTPLLISLFKLYAESSNDMFIMQYYTIEVAGLERMMKLYERNGIL
jgi:hypothetical protein